MVDGSCGSYSINASCHIVPAATDAVTCLPAIGLDQCKGYAAKLPQPLHEAQADILTAFFFDQLTCPDTGWHTYLPRLQQHASADSYLNTSIQAATLFVLANQHPERPELLTQARTEYSDALGTLNTALGDEDERLKDEVPCAVLILIMIEV